MPARIDCPSVSLRPGLTWCWRPTGGRPKFLWSNEKRMRPNIVSRDKYSTTDLRILGSVEFRVWIASCSVTPAAVMVAAW